MRIVLMMLIAFGVFVLLSRILWSIAPPHGCIVQGGHYNCYAR